MLRRAKQPRVPRLTDEQAEAAQAAADRVSDTHFRLADFIKPGMTLEEIDGFVARTLDEMGARSCFLHYRAGGAPAFAGHACLSLNDCIVHNAPAYHDRPLVEGDLLKVDIGVAYNRWIGDAAWTYAIGHATPDAQRLIDSGRAALERGVAKLHPDNTYLAWAREVQEVVEVEHGLHCVRGLGGHGIGYQTLHGPPFVSNVVPTHASEWPDASRRCQPGVLVAVEPMNAVGSPNIKQLPGEPWPIYTADGSLSSHHEADVLITEDGPRNLTARMFGLPDILPA